MSFLDSLVDIGSSAFSWFKGNSIASNIAKTAAIGFALNQLSKSIQSDSTANQNPDGTKISVNPSSSNNIPVVYGDTFIQGSLIDAVMTNNNQTMWYCYAICEKTGTIMSSNVDSTITFQNIYWDDLEIVMQSNGYTVSKLIDIYGNENTDINGLVDIYLYNNGSMSPCKLGNNGNYNTNNAFNIFPNWSIDHKMSNLVFAIVKINYNAEKNITGIGDLKFKINNTLTKPGDVLYDYMMNPIYGAGLTLSELNYA